MRWVTYQTTDDSADRVGLIVDGSVYGLEPGVSLLSLLGDDGQRLSRAGERARTAPSEVLGLAEVNLQAPIPQPPTTRDFYAFEQHVRTARQRRGLEMHPDWYELPVFYFSNPYATIGPNAAVAIPPGSNALDFELEIAAVVGRGGGNLSPAEAERCIAGFTIMNDWSARDLQRREMALSLGPVKGKDFATSLGPMLVTPDELEPYRKDRAYDLTMTASVNGVEYSRASFSDIFWSVPEMLAYASRGTRIAPGDVVGSGTCGTGCILELSLVHGEEAYPWLRPGDIVELAVDQLGSLRNHVVAGEPSRALR
ncbi:MAG TPA: fumarylacetoacetate hydrolase family protein [Chloroflexota bacterium]|nr:fumarylacetoacetate hydrolase family protein [Chloroflexota bacterium]